ncbi:MAG: AAA family ATPase [Thiothrix litoralis]|jgi:hypothetical protein|uniref:AAA family ATPase n=1 Tax=Thiothrix litoralis TaxID=2891210 RepID=UPI003C767F9B
MIRFPYGNSDFHSIRTKNMLYLDRTHLISALEQAGQQLLFLRPRRFGKSLLLSTLVNYYDIKLAEEFDSLFGDLAIGKNPTEERNQYLILRWDFSKVSAQGSLEDIKNSLFNHLNAHVEGFIQKYQELLRFPVHIRDEDALASFQSLTNAIQGSGQQLYLLIDEYDNFANEVLVSDPHNSRRYQALLEGEGILKSLFKIIKASASEGKLTRVFITGVSPVVMSDMTSGYNVAKNIYLNPRFNALCGLTQAELESSVTQVLEDCQQTEGYATILETLRLFYNGYRFCTDIKQPCVYNPTLVFYFLQHYQEFCSAPEQLLDSNLSMDANKIRYIADLPGGQSLIAHILDEQQALGVTSLEDRFGVESLRDIPRDQRFMGSLLYYFGVLTITGRSAIGELELNAPNLVIRGLYLEELKRKLLPNTQDSDTMQAAAKAFYQYADLQPLVEFIETRYFAALDNRDYRWSNELTVKTAFLTLLFNDTYYIMDSESALKRRYCDLVMIVRPNMRQYALLDFILEFKYLTLKELQLTAEQVRTHSREVTQQLPAVQAALANATQQLQEYRTILVNKYQEPQRLRCIAVVALGFERLVWEEVRVFDS